MIHTCHAEGCDTPVAPKFLMCPKHWDMVVKELKDMVWATYRPGQEVDKHPSREWLAAAHAAIDSVKQ